MSPTIFRAKGLRFYFFSREEGRMHVHVVGPEGEATIWIEPQIEVVDGHGLHERTLRTALDLVKDRKDEIRTAWNRHFGG